MERSDDAMSSSILVLFHARLLFVNRNFLVCARTLYTKVVILVAVAPQLTTFSCTNVSFSHKEDCIGYVATGADLVPTVPERGGSSVVKIECIFQPESGKRAS